VKVFQPAETIGSQRFRRFMEEVTSAYDLVVFDTAPLLPVSDTLQLVPQVDVVLLCVRVGQTTRAQAHAAKQALTHLPAKPTGVVIAGIRHTDDYYYYDDYSDATAKTRRGSSPA
jgi:Mrp family chromosome partitioning ATPase